MEDITKVLSSEDIDIIREVSNITVGTGATTLNRLFGSTVLLDTPVVSLESRDHLIDVSQDASVFVEIKYMEGLEGSNTVLLRESDVKMIAGRMMGTGNAELKEELNDMHLSAASEAMNQMMGSAATSLSSMLDKKISISPPELSLIMIDELLMDDGALGYLGDQFISVSTVLHLGSSIDSKVLQFYPLDLVHDICVMFKESKAYEKKGFILKDLS